MLYSDKCSQQDSEVPLARFMIIHDCFFSSIVVNLQQMQSQLTTFSWVVAAITSCPVILLSFLHQANYSHSSSMFYCVVFFGVVIA